MSPDHAHRVSDRRSAPRHPAHRLPSLRANLLAGPDVAVINVSRGGILLESDVRLRPGSGVCLNLALDDEMHRIDGHVLHVDARIVQNKVVYRAGIRFDHDVTIFDEPALRSPSSADEPIPAPPIDVTPRVEGVPDFQASRAELEAERDAERRQREEQARTISRLRDALRSGEQLRQEILESHAAERLHWQAEQQDLVGRVREAEEQASAMVQDMKAARETARRGAREHAAALAAGEARVRERDQQLTALRAEQAALLESVTRQLEEYESRDAARQAHHGRLSGQLAVTEAWCADQQDLLYRVRQQMVSMFALLEGTEAPASRPALASPQTRGALPARPVAPVLRMLPPGGGGGGRT